MALCIVIIQLTAILCCIPLGHTGSLKYEIIGGQEAVPHSKPWMAYITYLNQAGERLVCAGFLIRKDFVMTAAHCNGRNMQVSLGLHSVKERNARNTFSVLRNYPHNNYESSTHENDIMLLQIKGQVTLSNTVKVIPLPKKNKRVAVGTVCNVAGWGQVAHHTIPSVLMEVNVTVVGIKKCQDVLKVPISDAMMCAGIPGSKGDAAKGDSGAPLVCEGEARGIVSFGIEKPPGVYTHISSFLPWIRKILSSLDQP
ncbi:mast cell protease 8-like [Rhinophrynus dorsalis]